MGDCSGRSSPRALHRSSVQTSLPATTLYSITAPGYDDAVSGKREVILRVLPGLVGEARDDRRRLRDRDRPRYGRGRLPAPSPFCDAVMLHAPTSLARNDAEDGVVHDARTGGVVGDGKAGARRRHDRPWTRRRPTVQVAGRTRSSVPSSVASSAVVGDVVAVGPLGCVVALTRVVVLVCAAPVVPVALGCLGRAAWPRGAGRPRRTRSCCPCPDCSVDGAPSGTVVLVVVDGPGPPDATSLVDVDAPGGGVSCTSPVGGGASVSTAEPIIVRRTAGGRRGDHDERNQQLQRTHRRSFPSGGSERILRPRCT